MDYGISKFYSKTIYSIKNSMLKIRRGRVGKKV